MRLTKLFCVGLLLLVSPAIPSAFAMNPGVVAINHTYEAKIRLNGKVSTTQVQQEGRRPATGWHEDAVGRSRLADAHGD